MDVTDYSLGALVRHCDQLMESGELSKSKASGWKTACRSVIACLAPDLEADVRKIDVESAMKTYKGNNPNAAKKTLMEYGARLKKALASFVEETGKPLETPSDTKSDSAPERPKGKSPEVPESPLPKKPTSSHTLNIPLRPDFVAQLIIPYDIKHVEAKRIFRMLEVLAMDNEELGS
jgi:hypothetical protein